MSNPVNRSAITTLQSVTCPASVCYIVMNSIARYIISFIIDRMTEMSCNVLGDRQSPDTISVYPSDIVTLEWHHNFRNASDDIIATSHVGSGQIYISPDPPTSSSWIKIQSEGNNTEWYPGVKLNERLGKWVFSGRCIQRRLITLFRQDFVIPPGLAQGYYLVRGELL